jgi:hypothetical protein
MHVYEVRPRKDKRGVDLISDVLPFGRLWYGEPNAVSNAIGYAEHRSRSHDAMIRVYDEAGNVIETHEHAGVSKSGSDYFGLPAKRLARQLASTCNGFNRHRPRRQTDYTDFICLKYRFSVDEQ